MNWDTASTNFQKINNSTYETTQYCNSRENKQLLIIDNVIGTGTTFTVNLQEPLIIDSLTDIYLDSFVTFNALDNKHSGSNHIVFVLKIDQFEIKSNSSNSVLYNAISIPNEATADNIVKIHKGTKFNYISTINPKKITSISGSITNLIGNTSTDSNARFIAEFIFVSRT